MASASAVMIYTGSSLSAALSAVGSILFIEYAVDKSVGLKNRKYINAFNSTSVVLIEVILIGGLLAGNSFPSIVTASTLSMLVFFNALKRNSEDYINKDIGVRFGRRARAIVVVASMALSFVNAYYALIGAYVLTGLLVADSVEIFYTLYTSENSSKLKERILSRT